VDGGRGVRQTGRGIHAFGLAGPVLHSGTASATFEKTYSLWDTVVGVFRADHNLDSEIYRADWKRCALIVGSLCGGYAQVRCDGEISDEIRNIGWQTGDTVDVRIAFVNATTARIVFLFMGRTEARTLEDVPECGLRIGVGLFWNNTSVTLTTSSVNAGA
jgi:hypothetical protein